jgi:hypothetical protein
MRSSSVPESASSRRLGWRAKPTSISAAAITRPASILATASLALAKATGEPLLFKGDDFARTDVRAHGADSS